MEKYTAKELETFLCESNAIEGVYSERAYRDSLKAWEYLMKQEVMTLDVILETHRILMGSQDAWEPDTWGISQHYRGQFRDCDVYVGNKKLMQPNLIQPNLLMGFCFETMRKHPAPNWKSLHILYENIHPFIDGNGRTGRMFMNWTRLKRCNLPLTIIYKSHVQDYYAWFKN